VERAKRAYEGTDAYEAGYKIGHIDTTLMYADVLKRYFNFQDETIDSIEYMVKKKMNEYFGTLEV
jgi:hypothetical protein